MIYEGILPQHDYVFGKIMEDKETCKRFIEQTLDIKIRDLVYLEKQKTLDPAIDVKGIRLDVYVEDDQNTVSKSRIITKTQSILSKCYGCRIPKSRKCLSGITEKFCDFCLFFRSIWKKIYEIHF